MRVGEWRGQKENYELTLVMEYGRTRGEASIKSCVHVLARCLKTKRELNKYVLVLVDQKKKVTAVIAGAIMVSPEPQRNGERLCVIIGDWW